jgi:diguanylate cyclase (GGDEF)-like protein
MLPAGRLDPDDFPDSAYAQELRAGIDRLRFEPALETRFVAEHLQSVKLRVRAWYSLSVAMASFFTVMQTIRTGVGSVTFWAHALGIMPCALTLGWLVWSRSYERRFLQTARVLVPLFGALIAIFVSQAVGNHQDEQLAALTTNVVAAFFFAGLLFRAGLVAALTIVTAYAIGGHLFALQAPFALFKSVLALAGTAAMSAIIYRDKERADRRNFIESGLIAELIARDGLTGLANRRAFDEHLLRVWQQAQRDGRVLSTLMVDIDHFKTYNDSFGHQAGDAALRGVAQALADFARRPLDVAARFGGDEFAIVLYDLSIANVLDITERLRQSVQLGSRVTVSIGVSVVMPTAGRTPQGALQLADEALYEAKKGGRNRVVVKGIEEHRNLKTGSFQLR